MDGPPGGFQLPPVKTTGHTTSQATRAVTRKLSGQSAPPKVDPGLWEEASADDESPAAPIPTADQEPTGPRRVTLGELARRVVESQNRRRQASTSGDPDGDEAEPLDVEALLEGGGVTVVDPEATEAPPRRVQPRSGAAFARQVLQNHQRRTGV